MGGLNREVMDLFLSVTGFEDTTGARADSLLRRYQECLSRRREGRKYGLTMMFQGRAIQAGLVWLSQNLEDFSGAVSAALLGLVMLGGEEAAILFPGELWGHDEAVFLLRFPAVGSENGLRDNLGLTVVVDRPQPPKPEDYVDTAARLATIFRTVDIEIQKDEKTREIKDFFEGLESDERFRRSLETLSVMTMAPVDLRVCPEYGDPFWVIARSRS